MQKSIPFMYIIIIDRRHIERETYIQHRYNEAKSLKCKSNKKCSKLYKEN